MKESTGVRHRSPRLVDAVAGGLTAVLAVIAGIVPASLVRAADTADCGFAFEARFVESAPRDRFEFVDGSSGDTLVSGLTVSLAGSIGDLVFDTADGGTGVEVFQPFRVEEGESLLAEAVLVEDGGRRVDVAFEGFAPGERFVFSIDVDDRLARSELGQIRVTGSEIEGASLTVTLVDGQGERLVRTTTFGADARASVLGSACDS